MSWDIFVQDFPKDIHTIADIPDGFRPKSIGSRKSIIERIKEIVPDADFTDPAWGVINGIDWSIELNMGSEEDCGGFAFHVRGSEAAIGAVAAILDYLQLRAVDPQAGDFFVAGQNARASFQKWLSYRNAL